MASDSSLAIRFTTSSIRDLLTPPPELGNRGFVPIRPRRGLAERSGAKVNHMKGLRLWERREHCKLMVQQCQWTNSPESSLLHAEFSRRVIAAAAGRCG